MENVCSYNAEDLFDMVISFPGPIYFGTLEFHMVGEGKMSNQIWIGAADGRDK